MQLDAPLLIRGGQAVQVLVVADALFDAEIFCVRGGVGDTGAQVARVTGGEADFGGEPGHGSARQDDGRLVDGLDELPAYPHPAGHHGKAVQQRATGARRFLHSFLRVPPLFVAGVAVGGGRYDIGQSVAIQGLHEILLHRQGPETASGLGETAALLDGFAHYCPELLMLGQASVVIGRLVDVDLGTGRPTSEVLAAHGLEHVVRNTRGAERQRLIVTRHGFWHRDSRLQPF